ncbi:unnamed protein product [Closterium sp. NIES-54]
MAGGRVGRLKSVIQLLVACWRVHVGLHVVRSAAVAPVPEAYTHQLLFIVPCPVVANCTAEFAVLHRIEPVILMRVSPPLHSQHKFAPLHSTPQITQAHFIPTLLARSTAAMGGGAEASEQARGQQRPTISIAVPGSIIDNTQSLERATAVAGQIARAAVIFKVHEIVVYDDWDAEGDSSAPRGWRGERFSGSAGSFLARVLQYLDTPQYLRRALIPLTPDLRLAGLLPPLDAPHHARMHEWPEFREGVVVAEGEGEEARTVGSCAVDVGLQQRVRVRGSFSEGTRLTVAMGPAAEREKVFQPGVLLTPVAPHVPWGERGQYWGYTVRLARGVSGALSACPFSPAPASAEGGAGGAGDGGKGAGEGRSSDAAVVGGSGGAGEGDGAEGGEGREGGGDGGEEGEEGRGKKRRRRGGRKRGAKRGLYGEGGGGEGGQGGGEGGAEGGGAGGVGAYDLIVGTSEHGDVKEIGQFKLPPFRYGLNLPPHCPSGLLPSHTIANSHLFMSLHPISFPSSSSHPFHLLRGEEGGRHLFMSTYHLSPSFPLSPAHRHLLVVFGGMAGLEEACVHLLVVFGGVAGLEEACEGDEGLGADSRDPRQLCQLYLNTCPFQGSRTIRTEEAVLISLAYISALVP